MNSTLPGCTLDRYAKRNVATVGTRLGEQEVALLDATAKRLGLTRCHLVRRLLVERLLELQLADVKNNA